MNSLTTMYLCDLVGLKRFGNATGIINLFRGFGCFLGPFLAGLVSERFDDLAVFYFSSLFFAIGLAFAFLVSFSSFFKCCKGKNNDSQNETSVATANKAGDESDLNKNLLHTNA
jgi:MFS family permease